MPDTLDPFDPCLDETAAPPPAWTPEHVGHRLVEAMRTLEEFAAMRAAVDVPLLANMTEFGKSELFTAQQLADVGMNLVIWPVSMLRISMGATGRALDELNASGSLSGKLDEMQHRADLYDLVDYQAYNHFDTDVFNFTVSR